MESSAAARRLAREEDGQTLTEYALILVLISVAGTLAAALGLVQNGIVPFFEFVVGALNGAT